MIQGRGDILDKPSPQMQLFEYQFPNMPLGQGEHIQTRVESVPLR